MDESPGQREPTAGASMAVLPFVNVSADAEFDFFGDGLADELIIALSKVHSVRVVARTSAFSFKGTQADIRRIADTLGVNFVLEGTVRKSGIRLRVTAELINAADGCQVWSDRYDRELEMRDIFGIQDELTRAVLNAMNPNLPRTPTSSRPKPRDTECCGPRTVFKGALPSVQNDAVRHRGGRSILQTSR